MSYSVDFREFVVKKVHAGMSKSEAVKFFNIGHDTLYRWLKMHEETGSLTDRKRKTYKPQKIDSQTLLAEIERSPDATLEELAQRFSCSQVAVWKRLKNLGVTRKKNHVVRREE